MSDMTKTLKCNIVSPERAMFSGEVTQCQINGCWGGLSILPKHVPLITTIRPGTVTLALANGHEEAFYISGGILEVQPNQICILADTVNRADDYDLASSEQALENAVRLARDNIKKQNQKTYTEAMLELNQSMAQLNFIKRLKRK